MSVSQLGVGPCYQDLTRGHQQMAGGLGVTILHDFPQQTNVIDTNANHCSPFLVSLQPLLQGL